jgi:hypothetical protein
MSITLTTRMDISHDLLGHMRLDWRRTGRTPRAVEAQRRFASRHPELACGGVESLSDLINILEPRGGRTVDERCAIVRALLEDARDPMLHRALLQTLLPGIVSVCRQLRFGRGIVATPSDALDDAIATASELITDWAGQSRPYAAPDLLSALRGRLRRSLLKEKEAQLRLTCGSDHDVPVDTASPLLTRLAACAGGPHERLARLTFARVYEETPLRTLAHDDHSNPVTLQRELQQFALKFLL